MSEKTIGPFAPDGRELSGRDRLLLYRRGFGDGSRGSAMKHRGYPDYVCGWDDGSVAVSRAVKAYLEINDLPAPSVLRSEAPPSAGRDEGERG